ncbi:sporulation protein YqfD [Clostridium bornimense]|uniref:sporulation protein YqfD n=1 Tax=Clostridium bornimense TaxID=1216932 RepID=UPI001C0FFC36|nr:sporulation protein YqfD [Clostridium bornimense]MBU5315810.1 sporulation protein YqfD [Clostridium bornimense]
MNKGQYLNLFYDARLTLKIEVIELEELINTLIKNDIDIDSINRLSISSAILSIQYKDFQKFKEIFNKYDGSYEIIGKDKRSTTIYTLRNRISLVIGIVIFFLSLMLLNEFVWSIDIKTEKNISPFEIRNLLYKEGIKEGTFKRKINYEDLEEKLKEDHPKISWVSVRPYGSKLLIDIREKQLPPSLIKDDTKKDLIAKKDGIISRVYTANGTALVKAGDVVKCGDPLISYIEGDETHSYEVVPKGVVMAKTFYEDKIVVPYKEKNRDRTGKYISNKYIIIAGNKICVKKAENKFEKYDKIEENYGPFVIEKYYEVIENEIDLDKESVIKKAEGELLEKIKSNISVNSSIMDKKIDKEEKGDCCEIRMIIQCEEDISS